MNYRMVIGNMAHTGVWYPATMCDAHSLEVAEEVAEVYANRYLGHYHTGVGLLNWVGVQRRDSVTGEWETVSEFEA